ncbi:hypothetical protein CHARACLAT_009277 [Characodon lateralis]|uniref:Secreted protein n=1 Tax=Characodon lateralis TaxID=208331 RepID=A0ABU7D8B0_9TELE|nr:hypothetical protein [Characodon lateralis]
MTSSVISCSSLSYLLLSSAARSCLPACHSSAAVWSLRTRANGKEKKRPPPPGKPCYTHCGGGYRANTQTETLCVDFSLLFFYLNASVEKAKSHNGDSSGVCPCWLRPQPRTGNGAGPRTGLRRRASVQQPLVHRGGRLRDGVRWERDE